MTLNLNYLVTKHGEWKARRELITEVIKGIDPDLVTFQAVSKDRGIDQAMEIQNCFPAMKEHYFQRAETMANGADAGNAIISKFPFISKEHILLGSIDKED